MSHDEVSNPAHYKLFPDGTQAIDVIRAALSPEEYAGYLKGNFLKYRLRAGEKGPADKCIAKAEWYRRALVDFDREQRANGAPADDSACSICHGSGMVGAGSAVAVCHCCK